MAANPAYTGTAINALLPEIIDRNVQDLFPQDAEFITMFSQDTQDKPANNRGRYYPYITAPPGSFGFTSPAGSADLVGTSAMTDSRILVTTAHLESGLEIDYDAWVNNENGDAIIDAVVRNVTTQLGFFNKMRDIFASRGNGTAVLATASATSANGATTITCNGASDYIGTTNIFPGMQLDAYDATLATQRNTSSINVQSVSGTVITVTAMVLGSSIINTDVLIPAGQTAGLAGVPYHVAATGAYFDKADRTLTPGLVASIISSAGTLSAALMIKLVMYVGRRAQTMNLEEHAWFTSTTIWPVYRNIAYTNSRFVWNEQRPTTDIGQKGRSKKKFKDLSFDGDPIYVFKYWVPDRMDFLRVQDFEHVVLKEVGPMMSPAGDWLQAFNGDTSNFRHAVVKYIDSFEQTYCNAVLNQGALTGLTISGSETASPKAIGI